MSRIFSLFYGWTHNVPLPPQCFLFLYYCMMKIRGQIRGHHDYSVYVLRAGGGYTKMQN